MDDFQGFIRYLQEEELSDNTIENYIKTMRLFFERYDEVNKSNLIDFKNHLMKTKSPKTVNLRITGVEKYAKYKELHGVTVKRIKLHKISHVENVITIDEYNRLIEGLERDGNTWGKISVMILAMTGARISEALRLTKRDLDNGKAEMWTKGKVRVIYLPQKLRNEIKDYYRNAAPDDLLMRGYRGQQPKQSQNRLSNRRVDSNLKRWAVKYNIPVEHMHAHAFRHMFAIEFLKTNKDIALLADLLGHSGVNTTMIYLRQSEKEQKKAIDNAVKW